MKKWIVRILLIGLIGIQFFRPDRENPPVDATKDYLALNDAPVEVANLMRVACYDCHSNETSWPWYTNVAPVSWWVADHVEDARKHLNFSNWGDYDPEKAEHKLEECFEELEEGEMPLESYTYTHGDADLSPEQRELLVSYFKDAYVAAGGEMHEEHDEGDEHEEHGDHDDD